MSPARPRFTLRCLREDLGVAPPKHPATLDDIDHVLLHAAAAQYAADERPTQRIVAIDDNVLLKCKPNVPWRAAIWEGREGDQPWLVAAGPREDGSRDDLYARLKRECEARRKRLNGAGSISTKKTASDHLLPDEDDQLRLRLDRLQQGVVAARASVSQLVDQARHRPGQVFTATALGTELEAVVLRSDLDELFLAVRVVGAAPASAHEVILGIAVPGLQAGDWTPVQIKDVPSVLGAPADDEIVGFTLLEVPRLGL